MNLFAWNLTLAILWAAVSADFAPTNLAFGFVLGYVALLFVTPLFDDSTYHKRVWWVVNLMAYFVKELVVASIRVAVDVLTPQYHMRPGVIAIPLDVTSDFEITLFANMISLTPGTLSLDVSNDRKVLYIHAMYIDVDADTVRRDIKDGLERRVLRVTR